GVNEGLFFFAEAMADIVSAYFPFRDDSRSDLNSDDWAPCMFSSLLLDLMGWQGCVPSTTDPRSEERREAASQLRALSTFFVAAHEFAHIMLGHHKEIRRSDRTVPAGPQVRMKAMLLNHRQEYEADRYGLIVTLAFADLRGYNLALACWAVDFYFAAV